MADDSELDYLITFIGKVNTAHTVKSIETVRNISYINDTQAVLIFSGETVGTTPYSLKRQYTVQYKDASEGALNSSVYALREGIRKLNAREVITEYTKPSSLIGMKMIRSGKDYFNATSRKWYCNNILLEAEWLII